MKAVCSIETFEEIITCPLFHVYRLQDALFLGRERHAILVLVHDVKLGLCRNHGANELRYGFGHFCGVNTRLTEGPKKFIAVIDVEIEFVNGIGPALVHFNWVGNRLKDLLF